MKVVVIGSGGREHALAYKISESELLEKLFIVPGNPGTSLIGENVNLDISNNTEILQFCNEKEIDLVVIGPEQPLVNGLADDLRANDIPVFGPGSAAAEIEAHKTFAKNLMLSAKVPTAKYLEFNTTMYDRAKDFIKQKKYPCVIKADGLAAGKGVIICNNAEEAEAALKSFFIDRIFGKSGDKILIEEFLEGEEASVFAITDGTDFICLPASQDHKRIGDNDTGRNTGGMGAYAPAPIITDDLINEISEKIIAPTLQALKAEGKPFIGCLYAGLILTTDGVKVIEFNCRFGDPETQAVLPLLKGDFLKLLYSAAEGKIINDSVSYNGGASVCVVAASLGYPGEYQKGMEIFGLNEIPDNTVVFHAGTKEDKGKILTNGGRVLGVTSVLEENDLQKAKDLTYEALDKIHFSNMYYRWDIADKAIKQF
jgi:phosphoribosylamine---glycine ligase